MNEKIYQKSCIRYIYWSLAIISLFIPIIPKLMNFESTKWTIAMVENWILFLVVAYFILNYHRVSERLQEREECYRKVIDISPRGIIIHQEGTILFANPSAIKILREERLIGKSIFSYFHPDSLELSKRRTSESDIGNELPFVEIKLTRQDGKIIFIDSGSSSISFDGNPAILTVFRDITQRKKAEQALEESEKRYKQLVEQSPESIVVYQNEFIQYANPAFVKLVGALSFAELRGGSIKDYFHPDSVRLIENRINQIEKLGTYINVAEEKVKRLDGTFVDIEVTGITIKHKGKPAFLMMYHDLTSRKRGEEALRESEERYRLIAENMTDLVCVINWDGFFKYASPSHVTVLGFPSEAYEGNRARDWIHKDDFPQVRIQLEEMVKTKERSVFEFRFKNVKGDWIWLEGKATPVFDEEGHFRHFLVVSREITERRMYEEKLSHMAYHDTLTSLPNRRLFKERLEQALKEAERYGRNMAVMYMDMDKFKHINDTLGHDVGDALLKQFAQRVKRCLRESDTLSRHGGDEFIILLPEMNEEQEALHIAKRILNSFQEPWHIGNNIFHTTSSIGISFYPKDGITRHELLKNADKALYEAKEDGRNNVKTYSY